MSTAFAELAEPGLRPQGEPWPDVAAPSRLRRGKRLGGLALRLVQLWMRAATSPPLGRRERVRIGRAYSRALLRVLDVHLRVEGMLPAPDRPVLLVANHVSWLDTYAINCVSGARFIAKAEVRDWPLIGTVAAGFGSLFHRRHDAFDARRTVDAMVEVLRRGDPVGVFPEATTTSGTHLRPFYPAMFQAAIDAGVAVQPVAIRYRDGRGETTLTPAYCDEISLRESIERVVAAPSIEAHLHFAARIDPHGATRRELAEASNHSIGALLRLESPGCTHPPRHTEEPLRVAV